MACECYDDEHLTGLHIIKGQCDRVRTGLKSTCIYKTVLKSH